MNLRVKNMVIIILLLLICIFTTIILKPNLSRNFEEVRILKEKSFFSDFIVMEEENIVQIRCTITIEKLTE